MRVLYNICYSDPWVAVAKKLQEVHNYEPVYWIGYEDDDSERIVASTFPNSIYHHYYDAWAGMFPDVIEKELPNYSLDLDFLAEFAHEELLTYKMMDRMDPYRYKFNFMERQQHFRKLIRYWITVLEELKPEVIISASIPHRVFDYVLYLLCQKRNIPFISMVTTHFRGHILPLLNINSIGNILDADYKALLNSNETIENLKEKLHSVIKTRYDKIKLDYSEGKPEFVSSENIRDKKSGGVVALINKFIRDLFIDQRKRYFGKNSLLKKGIPVYSKINTNELTNKRISLLKYSVLKNKTNKYKKALKKYYASLTEEPDLNQKYILFNLHYQPEATSSPAGGVFVDLNIIVEVLTKNLPNDYLVYVKEHPAQFHSHREGHTNRIPSFYNNLKSHKNVRIIPLEYDPFVLIRNAKAVATISGSVGWEAMVLGKPVISFGLSWYEKYPGVLRITDSQSASMIMDFIDKFEFKERKLMAYLASFSQNLVKAYFYRGIKQQITISEEECVNNLVNCILKTKEIAEA